MKKLTALTLTFCLLLALTGCQKNTDSSGSGAVADQKGGLSKNCQGLPKGNRRRIAGGHSGIRNL